MKPMELKNLEEIEILGDLTGYTLVPENEFFALQKNDIYKEKTLPLGEKAEHCFYALLNGENILLQRGDEDIYIIADVPNFGISLLHYILNSVSLVVELASHLPLRKLFNINEEVLFMNSGMSSLRSMMQQEAMGVAPVQPAPQAASADEMLGGGGIAPKDTVNATRLSYFARKYGYVIGYICNVGPAISMSLKKTKVKDTTAGLNDDRYDIVTTQSKPSKIVRALIALPSGCCMKNGNPASPSEIDDGNIDYNEQATDLVYLTLKQDTAIAFIGALGRALPEYGPTHGEKAHYSAEDILNNNPAVGFVEVVSRANKKKDRKPGEDIVLTLKSTKRRCLFTPGNYIPLKLVKHVPTACKTAEDAMRVNKIAFGHWTKKAPNSNDSRLDLALSHTSSLIFKRQYEITEDGKKKTVEGIGSAYFMETPTIKLAEGVEIPQATPHYVPWYTVTKRGEQPPVTNPVTEIASKKETISQKSKKPHYQNEYLTVEDSLDSPAYKEYQPFLTQVERCMAKDELKRLVKERKRSVPGGSTWDPNVQASYRNFIHQESIAQDFESILHRFSRDQVMHKA